MTGGDLYTVAGDGTAGTSPDGTNGPSAEIDAPSGLAFDAAGNLLVAEFAGNRIRVVADTTGTYYGHSMIAGGIYTLAGTGAIGSTGDGRRHPGRGKRTREPDRRRIRQHRLHRVLREPGSGYRRHHRHLLWASDDRRRHLHPRRDRGPGDTGDGGPASDATFQLPVGVAVDRFGNLVVGDYDNNEVRVVAAATGTFYGVPMEAGDVYRLAGDGTQGSAGDGGPAGAAELSSPAGITVDPTGNVIFADSANNVIRVVAAADGTFYGQPMTTGDIYTIAGGGATSCPAGMGAPAPGTSAALSVPLGVAFAARELTPHL